eukprot:199908-Amphidinium_carterae.1
MCTGKTASQHCNCRVRVWVPTLVPHNMMICADSCHPVMLPHSLILRPYQCTSETNIEEDEWTAIAGCAVMCDVKHLPLQF